MCSRPPAWLSPVVPVCDALSVLFAGLVEIAAHDLSTGRVVALWNPGPGRAVGEDSLLDDLPASAGGERVHGPYAKVSLAGRTTTSVSVVLTDAAGERRGLLCINVDRSPLDQIAALAASVLAVRAPRPPELFQRDWREQIASRVHELCLELGLRRDQLDRDARLRVVARLDDEGLLDVRGAADLTAQALGVSRATVYTLLKDTRTSRGALTLEDAP